MFEVRDGAAATSGIGRAAGSTRDGRPAHHLLDPATGRPAFTGVVQATALAPTALEAEWRAKAAVLSADRGLARAHGGVLVLDDGSHHVHPNQGDHHEEEANRGAGRGRLVGARGLRFAGRDETTATTAAPSSNTAATASRRGTGRDGLQRAGD